MSIDIACSTSIRTQGTLEEALAEISRIGFSKVDLLAIGKWAHINPRDMAENWVPTVQGVDELLEQYALTPIVMNTGTTVQLHDRSENSNCIRREEIQALTRFMQHYDITIAAIQPLQKDPDRNDDDVFEDCLQTLREQKRIGDETGVLFALEVHTNAPIETPEDAKKICDAFPELPLAYDPTHFVLQGRDLRETRWMMDKAIHVHIRDAARGMIQTPFGQGEVDFDWILNSLKDAGYSGGFSIEYLQLKDGPDDYRDDVLRARDAILRHFE